MGADILSIDGFECEFPAAGVAVCYSGYRIYLRLGAGHPGEGIGSPVLVRYRDARP
jgi:hypothetical protein